MNQISDHPKQRASAAAGYGPAGKSPPKESVFWLYNSCLRLACL